MRAFLFSSLEFKRTDGEPLWIVFQVTKSHSAARIASVTDRSNSRYSCIRAINLLRYGSRSGSLTVAVSIAMPGDFAPAMRTDCVPLLTHHSLRCSCQRVSQ